MVSPEPLAEWLDQARSAFELLRRGAPGVSVLARCDQLQAATAEQPCPIGSAIAEFGYALAAAAEADRPEDWQRLGNARRALGYRLVLHSLDRGKGVG